MATPRSLSRIAVNILVDGLLATASVPLSCWIAAPHSDRLFPAWSLAAGCVSLLIAGLPFRLSTQYWRFAGIGEVLGVTGSAVFGAALFALAVHQAGLALPTPTFPIVQFFVLVLLLGAPRVIYRLMQEGRLLQGGRLGWRALLSPADEAPYVLLLGAGESADLFIRALKQERNPPYRVAGLIPLSSRQAGRRIHGYPILGGMDAIAATLRRLRREHRLPATIVVTEEIGGTELSALLDDAEREGVQVRRAPRPTALLHPPTRADPNGHVPELDLKPVAIEDLLNRPQVPLDREGMARLIQGRRVLVTGAGGTIGSELARQVAALGPDLLVLVDNGEYALWQIDLELAESSPNVSRRAVIADIRDETRLRDVFERMQPELVFHAAALKHVPMVEDNPLEGLLTNAVGTRHVADAARAVGSKAMVLISTDKAVNPTSVMGASKRLAEMYCQGLDVAALDAAGRGYRNGMRCVTVRFGNVLGSTGSVVPLFQRQLARGGPLTVTHPDMQRYFMTVREAVGLVLQASVVGTSDRQPDDDTEGGIFVLDMGQPVKIVDLARQMIRLAGYRPDQDIDIRFTGLRPGEKLYEELFHGKEPPRATGFAGLLMATPRTVDPSIVGRAVDEIASACRGGQVRLALNALAHLVPEFEHNVTGMAGAVHRLAARWPKPEESA
jgi:FlaA1/EpsC-like NDP-sugar epimerase